MTRFALVAAALSACADADLPPPGPDGTCLVEAHDLGDEVEVDAAFRCPAGAWGDAVLLAYSEDGDPFFGQLAEPARCGEWVTARFPVDPQDGMVNVVAAASFRLRGETSSTCDTRSSGR